MTPRGETRVPGIATVSALLPSEVRVHLFFMKDGRVFCAEHFEGGKCTTENLIQLIYQQNEATAKLSASQA